VTLRDWLHPGGREILRHGSSPLVWLVQTGDIAVSLGVLYVCVAIRLAGDIAPEYRVLAVVIALAMVVWYQWSGLYRSLWSNSLWLEAHNLLRVWIMVLLTLFALAFATKTGHWYSRQALFYWCIFGYLGQFLWHASFLAGLQGLRRRGFNTQKAVIVGRGAAGLQFARRLMRTSGMGIHAIGYLSDEPAAADATEVAPSDGGFQHLGPVAALEEVIRREADWT
jgi:undecaprenyl-phosphate glucose phosphotransferase